MHATFVPAMLMLFLLDLFFGMRRRFRANVAMCCSKFRECFKVVCTQLVRLRLLPKAHTMKAMSFLYRLYIRTAFLKSSSEFFFLLFTIALYSSGFRAEVDRNSHIYSNAHIMCMQCKSTGFDIPIRDAPYLYWVSSNPVHTEIAYLRV